MAFIRLSCRKITLRCKKRGQIGLRKERERERERERKRERERERER